MEVRIKSMKTFYNIDYLKSHEVISISAKSFFI